MSRLHSENTVFTPNTDSLLSASNLACIRGDRLLFEALDINIAAGDIVQVEGPNGAGKTSLLRILSGLSQPYDGTVYFQDESITQQREAFHQDLLYLGHLPGVKDEMTAQENLEFNLALHGLNSATAEATLTEVNLLGFEDALAAHLSAGQHRRISLARLWQSQAKIWILDEPFTAIDKLGVEKLEQLFLQHADNGGCVILTTHQDISLPAERVKKVTLAYRFY
ncbi:cytochrome c biogenesis heme-transporting ATPase CcmA [Colwellia sp. MB02u-10]|uniref:cytochrome c biogenesis heme-transporting ATPase CcmA n=1 Tax=Colwellia sp. MB02u-10 TaxID=2759828 RepID=UPI0015F72E7B|nr:cytochrome c biogenesis heme-transporting ATPase CcmA [Colwellia sp. MB02u-10]MBA6342301.1 cytochrome c biogenesis heme-transporting ATPase CcmA [Colwellia sp. MB02u-10]